MKLNSHQTGQNKKNNPNPLLENKAWVFQQMNQIQIDKNIFATFEFNGHVNVLAFEKTLEEIYLGLECLEQTDQEVLDENQRRCFFSFEYVEFELKNDLQNSLDKMILNESDFDLESTCLFKSKLVKLEDRKFLLTVNIHQKINEGLTPLILLKKIMYLYKRITKDDIPKEPIVAIQYI